jgi:hypothetical protein
LLENRLEILPTSPPKPHITNLNLFPVELLGRRIQFLHNLGKGELSAEFLNTTYTLQVRSPLFPPTRPILNETHVLSQVGAFQMVVLMQFNDSEKYSYEDLKKRAGEDEK